jgi:3-deoxy-manno-octulosonate cytidylyltransferase (CMP-KDO synthetase)
MKTVVIIPARLSSSRLPGKVLADLGGKPIVQWVYEVASATSADAVYAAADDTRVVEAVEGFGGRAVMTSPACPSGTDRVSEALERIPDGDAFDLVVNLQGDEPFLPPNVVDGLIDMMADDPSIQLGTVAVPAERAEIASDPSKVKAVLAAASAGNRPDIRRALYFTRAAAPYLREGGAEAGMFLHWGIYAYRRDVLKRIVALPESPLERCEKLEQLRALENGISISALVAEGKSAGIDTPEDLENARRSLEWNSK